MSDLAEGVIVFPRASGANIDEFTLALRHGGTSAHTDRSDFAAALAWAGRTSTQHNLPAV